MTISVITGGCGFIGSHHVDLLVSKGHEVRIIDNMVAGSLDNIKQHIQNRNVILHTDDINDLKTESRIFKDADYVFHFAGLPSIRPSLEDPAPYIKTNVYGTAKVLECARYAKVKKFIYAASSACYGEADVHPTPETAEIKLQHPYGLSKHLGEVATLHWYHCFGLPTASIRMFDITGEGADSTVMKIFLDLKRANKPITIFGDGNQERDFVDVRDVCRAYLMLAESNIVGEVINIGSGKPQTVNYLVDLLGCERVYLPKRENEPYLHCADISKAKKLLGWEPEIPFEETIKRILASISA
jgi:UDP-glucose 4-epimerase